MPRMQPRRVHRPLAQTRVAPTLTLVKTIRAAELDARSLALLDPIDPDGVVITKRGKPVARLVPWLRRRSRLIGSLKGRMIVTGNLLSTGERWDAES
jgi:antitoxin (DNA-binding transcriptional repressor) of toxin-antitoxin stability system